MLKDYRRFMKSYVEIAKPLHELTKKEEQFVWIMERDNTFISIKKCLGTAPILGYPDAKSPSYWIQKPVGAA